MAVTFRAGKGIRPLVDEKDMSAFLTEVSVAAERDPLDVTTFQDNDRNYIPGLGNVTASMDGFFAASTTAVDDLANYMDSQIGGSTKMVVTIDMQGTTGGRALMLTGDHTAYDIDSKADDVVGLSVDIQGSNGYAGGVMLRPLSAATSTGSNTGVITPGTTAAGGTTGGGVAHLHVTEESTANAVFKVQHSTSGSTWADLITFATVTSGPTFQRSTVAGTVKERVRSTISTFSTSTGTESVTAAVAFSRRART